MTISRPTGEQTPEDCEIISLGAHIRIAADSAKGDVKLQDQSQ